MASPLDPTSPSLPSPPVPFTASHRALSARLEGLNVYLVGMMGSGKSATGRPLAEALGYRFLDADTTLERAAGRSIPEIFASEGEEGFRELETMVLNQISSWHSLVVATGGGVVSRPMNWGHLRQGVVVWLDAPEPLLLQRLAADPTPRPLLTDPDPAGRLASLMALRRPLYAQADLTVVPNHLEPPQTVALRILEGLPAILRERAAPPLEAASLVDREGHPIDSINASAQPCASI